MRKWTRTIPTVAAFAASAALSSRVPAVAPLDLSRLLPPSIPIGPGEITRTATLLLMPMVALAVLLLFTALERVRGTGSPLPSWWLREDTGAAAVQRFAPTYNTVVFSVTALFLIAHIVILSNVIGAPDWVYSLATALLGFGFMAGGNIMPRVRPNWIMGLRTRRTLSDPGAWSRTHRLLGKMLLGVGSMVVLLSIVAPRYAFAVGIIALLASLILSHAIGTRRPDPGSAPA
jgi:hypothetical protein